MNWYIRIFIAFSWLQGALVSLHAQPWSSGQGNILPVSYSGTGYREGVNQAMKASESDPFISVVHSNLYGVKALALNSFVIGYPFHPGTFSVTYSGFGYSLYREHAAGLSFARSLGKYVKAGIQIDYLLSRSGEQQYTTQAATFEGGLITEPVKNLYLAFHLFNPLQINYSDGKYQHLPTVIRLGAGYNPGEKVLLITEVEKDTEYPLVMKASVDFKPTKFFVLRYGIHNTMGHYSGISVISKKGIIDAGLQWHPSLGFSVSGGYCYVFKGRN